MSRATYRVLTRLAESDAAVTIVTADMGKFGGIASSRPQQLVNVGIAESNSVSIAAGLAYEGRKVFVYSVAGFTVERAYEQIKYCLGSWRQPVCLVGTGIGWNLSSVGRGHHPTNDLALMRTIPNMHVRIPSSEDSLARCLSSASLADGPTYVRLGAMSEESTAALGRRLQVVALGSVFGLCVSALHRMGLPMGAVGIIGIESLDTGDLQRQLARLDPKVPWLVVEDHACFGGLGDAIRCCYGHDFEYLGLPLVLDQLAQSADDLKAAYGFDPPTLSAAMTRVMRQ